MLPWCFPCKQNGTLIQRWIHQRCPVQKMLGLSKAHTSTALHRPSQSEIMPCQLTTPHARSHACQWLTLHQLCVSSAQRSPAPKAASPPAPNPGRFHDPLPLLGPIPPCSLLPTPTHPCSSGSCQAPLAPPPAPLLHPKVLQGAQPLPPQPQTYPPCCHLKKPPRSHRPGNGPRVLPMASHCLHQAAPKAPGRPEQTTKRSRYNQDRNTKLPDDEAGEQ